MHHGALGNRYRRPWARSQAACASRQDSPCSRNADTYYRSPGGEPAATEGSLTQSRIALVTGAGSGIGRAVSIGLARPATAWFSPAAERMRSRKRRRASAARHWRSPPISAIPNPLPGSSPRSRAAFGRLDVLFNNAGVNAPAIPLDELTPEQWQAVVNANLSGAFYCTQEAFRLMKAQDPKGGRIINNGSISAHVPRPYSAPYTATKHGITGLTRATSLDGRPTTSPAARSTSAMPRPT